MLFAMNQQSIGTNKWLTMTTMPKMTEFALKWYHECYQILTPKYPTWHYLSRKQYAIPGILKATSMTYCISVQ
jgi:hypothetical protein